MHGQVTQMSGIATHSDTSPPSPWFALPESRRLGELASADLSDLVDSLAVLRLKEIGFLGILGPGPLSTPIDTRFSHSLAVAHLSLVFGLKVCLPRNLVRHLVAAALVHDIANRALSHTCEGAFDSLTRTNGHILTRALVMGEPHRLVPRRYQFPRTLARLGLDPTLILSLLTKRPAHRALGALTDLVSLFASPINFDTLDGILRAAWLLGMNPPDPLKILSVIDFREGTVGILDDNIFVLDEFWTAKALVYRAHINSHQSIWKEHLYALAANAVFHGLTSGQVFQLTDKEVRPQLDSWVTSHTPSEGSETDKQGQLDLLPAPPPLRFREPRTYVIDSSYRLIKGFIPLSQLTKRYKAVGESAGDFQLGTRR